MDPGRITVIPLGIDTDFFRPAPQVPPPHAFRCITVGFWLRDFELLARLVKRMAGSGIEFHIVAPEIGSLPLTSDIVWHRNISDDALVTLYQSAHALLLPLKAATANNALLEGMACGLPILSTRLASVEEYLGGAEAILAAPGDEAALVDGINRLRDDEHLRQRLALGSRRRAEELDWRAVAAQYQRIYEGMSRRG
jgi:glycosyltransferase involved in cell wall biosynthesis